jgi:hypothetical protein
VLQASVTRPNSTARRRLRYHVRPRAPRLAAADGRPRGRSWSTPTMRISISDPVAMLRAFEVRGMDDGRVTKRGRAISRRSPHGAPARHQPGQAGSQGQGQAIGQLGERQHGTKAQDPDVDHAAEPAPAGQGPPEPRERGRTGDQFTVRPAHVEAPQGGVAIQTATERRRVAGAGDIHEGNPVGPGAAAVMVDLGPAERAAAIVIDAEISPRLAVAHDRASASTRPI